MAHYDILDKEFGKEKIFGGTAYISTAMNNYGSIQQITSRASIKFGPRTPKNINIAKLHSKKSGLKINYLNASPENLEHIEKFDIILRLSEESLPPM